MSHYSQVSDHFTTCHMQSNMPHDMSHGTVRTRHLSSMEMPAPKTAMLRRKSSVAPVETCMRVLRRVIPPPMFPSKKMEPENTVGNLKAAMALVSCALSRDVLLTNMLQETHSIITA